MTVPAAAGAAGARGHDVAEQAAHGALDLAAAVADVAGDRRGAGRAAGAVAGLAEHGRVDLELARGAEDDLVELDVEAQQRVLAALAAAAGTAPASGARAEERLEDVAETAEVAAAAETALGLRAQVVLLALLRVAEHVVGVRDRFEALRRIGARVHVGVQLAGEAAVRLLDLLGARVALDAQDFVVVCHGLGIPYWSSPNWRDR